MRGVLIGILAVVTLATVIFDLIEMYAARRPSAPPPEAIAQQPPSPPEPPAAAIAAPPTTTPPPPAPPLPSNAPAIAPPPAPPADPLDVVVNGKTKREWHAYFAERARQMQAEMARAQPIVDRMERGEEPDPVALGEAQTTLKELRERLKQDAEALTALDATNP